jgi:hypothetical protein
MPAYNAIYRKFIDDRNVVTPSQMVRAKFYLIKSYEYVDGTKGRYTDASAPIIFTLFTSIAKDIVHAVKVSDVRPDLIKRFFGKMVNQEEEQLEYEGSSAKLYEAIVSKVPIINNNAYRTYKMSGFGRILELDMELNNLIPKRFNVTGISKKSQVKNK